MDRELVASYHLNISVESGLIIDYTIVSVQITDINDNPPKFVYNSTNSMGGDVYVAYISATLLSKTNFLTVKVSKLNLLIKNPF